MMKTLLKAINQAENLYQLYYYKGYINASYNDGVLKEKDYWMLKKVLNKRIKIMQFLEE